MFNWDNHRSSPRAEIDLFSAFKEAHPKMSEYGLRKAKNYLDEIETLMPINSRQAAALAIVAAADYAFRPNTTLEDL